MLVLGWTQEHIRVPRRHSVLWTRTLCELSSLLFTQCLPEENSATCILLSVMPLTWLITKTYLEVAMHACCKHVKLLLLNCMLGHEPATRIQTQK